MIKFLVLILVAISPLISIYADKELMINECHNAPVPATCMQCLESDKTSLHAVPHGIANIILHCLDSHLHILTKDIMELLANKQKGDAIKTSLVDCQKYLSRALTMLPDAKTSLKTGDYDKAGQSIMIALMFPMRCKNNLQRAKFDKSQYSDVYNEMSIYAQLSDAAMRIIDRL